ncbi:activated Cdc42 kinase-like [Bicyclus anynana]|uniref:Activated Cdc42 kinase-like n=1 Tax=Bicyclus anynana TaxID=110368 RepID=A0ABM3M5D8_BICAN|nr:activated Cdc42 kinase-like [Bicyclus anynana]
MKPMSAQDEKTLDTAVALANEITSKSMNDLENEQKPVTAPCERSKFPFKFPLVASLHHATHQDADKEADKAERRTFSEEAKSVPDIQASLTRESKKAYECLIEKPTPASLISQINEDMPNDSPPPKTGTGATPKMTNKISTIPKPAPRQPSGQFHSLQKQIPYQTRSIATELSDALSKSDVDNVNVIPLPPRGSKPKLVDKPRHFRKYPLKLPTETVERPLPQTPPQVKPPPVIYQNTLRSAIPFNKVEVHSPERRAAISLDVSAASMGAIHGLVKVPAFATTTTNPFTNTPESIPSTSSVNPFIHYIEDDTFEQFYDDDSEDEVSVQKDFERVSLTKDHVSVEDLLEFADQKPSARQRGVESDEVRIMNKVLKKQVTPEDCLEALEFSAWNVHIAIKLLKVKISVGEAALVTLEDCSRELDIADGDIVKASAVLTLCNKNTDEYFAVLFVTSICSKLGELATSHATSTPGD